MPSIEGGGVEKNLFIISNYLAKKLNDVYLISSSTNFKSHFKNLTFLSPNYKFNDKDGRYIRYFYCILELIKLIIRSKRKVTIFAFQANLYCAIIGKIFSIKTITRSNSSPSGWSKNYIKKILFKIFLNFPDKVIVNSIEFKKEIKNKFNVNTFCIYNPLDKKNILLKSKEKLNFKFFDDSKKCLKIIFVGRFVDQKDPITLINGLNVIKKKINFKALLVGRGILENEMKKLIKFHKLNKFIKIINFQSNPYKYILKADTLILSSKFEGLPNVLLEAQVLKKNIISSDCPTGPSEILINGKAGYLFKCNSYKELANKIQESYYQKKITKKKINIGYENLYRFDYNKNLDKYLQIIKKFL